MKNIKNTKREYTELLNNTDKFEEIQKRLRKIPRRPLRAERMNKKILTSDFLTLSDINDITILLQNKHNVDYNVTITSVKNSSVFEIEFKEA